MVEELNLFIDKQDININFQVRHQIKSEAILQNLHLFTQNIPVIPLRIQTASSNGTIIY